MQWDSVESCGMEQSLTDFLISSSSLKSCGSTYSSSGPSTSTLGGWEGGSGETREGGGVTGRLMQ